MNAVEIEQAVSELAGQAFDAAEFPFAFLLAFGNKETTIKRLRTGASNKSDLGGVLQAKHIHIAVCPPAETANTLAALKASPATAKAKARFILATDGAHFEAEDLETGETVACAYQDFPDHFGFFLPLAGITTVQQIRENAFDIRATGRLNKLYVELLKENPDWGTADRRHDMNVDIIIALGMAKEGFDWIWCEHALTVGYRASLTEIIQIIGRATRDAPGKTRARFTNLIAEPDAAADVVTEAVNDTLKAIAASLLMEQVLAPRFEFKPKTPVGAPGSTESGGPTPGFNYGEGGYDPNKCNVGFNEETGKIQIEIKGLVEPKSPEATRICQEDLNEVIAAFVQDKRTIERGLFDKELVSEELTQVRMGKIVSDKYPELSEEDKEAVRQHAIAAFNILQQAKQIASGGSGEQAGAGSGHGVNTALIDGVRKFAMDVRELEIDLIDRINPFGEAYAILAKAMGEESLKQVEKAIAAKRTNLTPEEARELAVRAARFKRERGRLPSLTAQDAWEKRMAEGAAAFVRFKDEGRYDRGKTAQ